MLLRWHD
ncbi:hypothetical protein HU200_016974 [Digitaria exilis]|nr:hypothetical protein HU200_050455 [Digitaria exilis]KAF8730398.1 hypothetical protein HU200_016974 [Digitaria exilis]